MRYAKSLFLTHLVLINLVGLAQAYSMQQQAKRHCLTNFQSRQAFNLGIQAYIYGYPAVLMDATKTIMAQKAQANNISAFFNRFIHAYKFLTSDFHDVVSPNTDTLYSSAWLDLSVEPLVLHVPDTTGRYYLMEMLDAWTNVFANPGTRTTGSSAHDFLITGPDWHGVIPENFTHIKAPTNTVWIIGRMQAFGPTDYPKVNALQNQYTLTSLSNFNKQNKTRDYTTQAQKTTKQTISPAQYVASLDAQKFFEILARVLRENPPPAFDASLIKQLEKLGISSKNNFDITKLDPEIARTLEKAVKAAQLIIKRAAQAQGSFINGWRTSNVPGMGNFGTNYLLRAIIASFVLGANLPEDAVYFYADKDSDNQLLTGKNCYKIHLPKDQLPPVNAFWSLTLYNQDHFFAQNPLNRYTIHNYDKLAFNPDGSLDIFIQHNAPELKYSTNWLPAPEGNFNLLMRLYWPRQEVLNNTWKPPQITKIK